MNTITIKCACGCLLFLASMSAVVADEEPTPTLEQRIEEAREEQITKLQAQLEDLSKRALSTRDRAARRSLSQRIKSTKATIRKLEDKKVAFEPEIEQFDQGEFGRVPRARSPLVFQVIDEDKVLVRMTFDTRVSAIIARERSTDAGGSVTTSGSVAYVLVLIEGISTNGLRDGGEFPGDGYFLVNGTRQYETADGTNTVPLVLPVAE